MHINDLPTELLEDIFLLSISESQHHPSKCHRYPSSSSIISKICRRWRDTALNFPHLWNHLHVVDPQHLSIVQDLQVWMHRAGALPLCLSLCQNQSYDAQASVAILTLFLNSLNRCQSFELFLLQELLPLGNIERFPSIPLQSVNVCCPNLGWAGLINLELLADLLFNTHSLRTIRWFCRLSRPRVIPLSCENLLELSTDSIGNIAEFLNALSQCQNLERLEIRGHPYIPNTSDVIPSFSLPRVTHLSLELGSSSTNMLSPLLCQSLVDLEVVLLHRLRQPLTSILDMIHRSGAILRRLRIANKITIGRYRRLARAEFISALRTPYFHELRILEIEEPMSVGRDIVKFLTLPTSSNGGYLTNLERIHLVFHDTLAELLQPLQELIESRPGMLYDSDTPGQQMSLIRISLSIPSVPTA